MTAWLIAIRQILITQLKGAALKAALSYFIKSPVLLGFRQWLIKYILEEFFNEIGEPLARGYFYRLGYAYSRIEGKIYVKKLTEAKEENNQSKYDTVTDVIFE